MARRTIEIDERLLQRAKRALGSKTTQATVEEALRRAADAADRELADSAARQRDYLGRVAARMDMKVLRSEDMWE